MLIAASHETKSGRKMLFVGLSRTNIERLLADKPILKQLNGEGTNETEGVLVEGLEEWDLVVAGPEDTARFVAATSPERLTEFLAEWQ
jgi:hypothetical protein